MARTAFMGTPEFALPALAALARLTSLQAVVAQPDKPSGRGREIGSPPTVVWARANRLPVLQPARAKDEAFLADLIGLDLDLIVVAAYGKILPRAVLEAPRLGCVNVHASLLPMYRGAAPIQWAIARGAAETGITLMQMDEGLDTGPMLAQARLPVGPEETGGELSTRLAILGGELLAASLPAILQRALAAVPQDSRFATQAPKLTREDAVLDLTRPARELHDRVRAFQPWPGAIVGLRGKGGLKVLESRIVAGSGLPGTVLAAGKEGITLATGEGALCLLAVQPEGKRRMSAGEFLAGHPLRAGERLGL
jgi:methionyl-tRNA formyltransferase